MNQTREHFTVHEAAADWIWLSISSALFGHPLLSNRGDAASRHTVMMMMLMCWCVVVVSAERARRPAD